MPALRSLSLTLLSAVVLALGLGACAGSQAAHPGASQQGTPGARRPAPPTLDELLTAHPELILEHPGLLAVDPGFLIRHPRFARAHPGLLFRDPALQRQDPALRFLLLDVPADPPLRPRRRLRAAAGEILVLHLHGQEDVVIRARHPNGRVVLFAHGSDQTPNFDVDAHRSAQAIIGLLHAGYAWAESTADFNNWGNAASLADDVALAHWLRHHGLRTLDLGGDSMGGLDAIQLIPRLHPQAVFELFPVCDERTMLHLFGVDIRHSGAPLAQLSPVPMRGVRGLPLLITASPQDTLVPKATNADVCAAEARAAGARVREVTTRGGHDDPSNWRPRRLVAFLNAAGRSAAARPRGSGPSRRRVRRPGPGPRRRRR
ncbi:MAG TPA: hypothetical protein VFN48_04085 [Solirubrobacteraceae bacterium]|nr:hypothetical protein [Solirubrobacteraceae bacterium]